MTVRKTATEIIKDLSAASERVFIIAMGTSILSSGAIADDAGFGLEAGVVVTDNVARYSAGNETDETMASVGVNFAYETESRGLETNFIGDLKYLKYFDDTFDPEPLGALNADVRLIVLPSVFSWTFKDRYGVVNSNPFGVDSPENRESVNHFSTAGMAA